MSDDELCERLRADLEAVQWYDRPLPWVVHTGCSYRRIASQPTRENLRTFADGNVLHAQRHNDGCMDLSMGERELEALVSIVNAEPGLLDRITALKAELAGVREAADELQSREAAYREMHDLHGGGARATGRCWDLMRRAGDKMRAILSRGDVEREAG